MNAIFEYKSVIAQLVQVKGDSENKKELYKKNLTILFPQVQKMKDLSTFNELMTAAIVGYIQNILKAGPPKEQEQEVLLKVFDVVLTLDYLKTWQAGLNNDFSMYRRAIQHVRKDYNLNEDEDLRLFLINPNNINKGLKQALIDKCPQFEKVLARLIKYCADKFEKDNQNFQLLRVAVFSVYLIDGLLSDVDRLNKIKKVVKFARISKWFKSHPRVPLYKQLPFNVQNYLKGCPNFSAESEK